MSVGIYFQFFVFFVLFAKLSNGGPSGLAEIVYFWEDCAEAGSNHCIFGLFNLFTDTHSAMVLLIKGGFM